MKQWRLRKAANKLAHFHDPARGHHGSSATVPLNGTSGGHSHANNEFCGSKSPNGGHKFECEISPSSSSRRLQQPALHGQGGSEGGSRGSRGSRGSDSEFNAGMAAPGSDGYGRDLKRKSYRHFKKKKSFTSCLIVNVYFNSYSRHSSEGNLHSQEARDGGHVELPSRSP